MVLSLARWLWLKLESRELSGTESFSQHFQPLRRQVAWRLDYARVGTPVEIFSKGEGTRDYYFSEYS